MVSMTYANSEAEIKLRHYKNNLSIGGKCYVLFGVWTVVKIMMQMLFGDPGIKGLIDQTEESGVDRTIATAVIISMHGACRIDKYCRIGCISC